MVEWSKGDNKRKKEKEGKGDNKEGGKTREEYLCSVS